jgi:hypothetical protein
MMEISTSIFLIGLIMVALIMGITGYALRKYMILFYLSALLWCIMGIIFLTVDLSSDMPVALIAIMCFLSGIAMLFSPIIVREKPEQQTMQPNRPTDRLERKLERYNKTVNRFRK